MKSWSTRRLSRPGPMEDVAPSSGCCPGTGSVDLSSRRGKRKEPGFPRRKVDDWRESSRTRVDAWSNVAARQKMRERQDKVQRLLRREAPAAGPRGATARSADLLQPR